jgi:type III pantothenate kinase
MILTIDIGNTNIKLGLFEGDSLRYSFRLSSHSQKTSDEYGVDMIEHLARKGYQASIVHGIIIGSVKPSLNYSYERACEYYFGIRPLFVGSGIKTGIDVKYDNPKEVGADRIAGCVAAVATYGAPLIVIDCGTATTYNVINAKKQFVGGAIAPGLKTSADHLSMAAARLPNVELSIPESTIGRSTITNMQSGIIYSYIGGVQYMVSRIASEMGCKLRVVATGGLSEIVARTCAVFDVIDRGLTLAGLNIIYGLNA